MRIVPAFGLAAVGSALAAACGASSAGGGGEMATPDGGGLVEAGRRDAQGVDATTADAGVEDATSGPDAGAACAIPTAISTYPTCNACVAEYCAPAWCTCAMDTTAPGDGGQDGPAGDAALPVDAATSADDGGSDGDGGAPRDGGTSGDAGASDDGAANDGPFVSGDAATTGCERYVGCVADCVESDAGLPTACAQILCAHPPYSLEEQQEGQALLNCMVLQCSTMCLL